MASDSEPRAVHPGASRHQDGQGLPGRHRVMRQPPLSPRTPVLWMLGPLLPRQPRSTEIHPQSRQVHTSPPSDSLQDGRTGWLGQRPGPPGPLASTEAPTLLRKRGRGRELPTEQDAVLASPGAPGSSQGQAGILGIPQADPWAPLPSQGVVPPSLSLLSN